MQDTLPDDKQKQDGAHNPAQQYYDREFNEIAGGLKAEEEKAVKGMDFDEIEKYANKDRSNKPENASDAVGQSEQSGFVNNFTGNSKRDKAAFTLRGALKKGGPTGIIAAVILGLGTGLGFFGTAALPFNIVEVLTNDLNDPHPSQQRKTINLFGNKVGGDAKEKAKACAQPSSIRCKMNSITTDVAKRFEDKGFKFGDKTETGGRITFSNLVFPDGTSLNNPREFENHIKNSNRALSVFNTVHNLKTGIFNYGDFFSKKVLAANDLTKGKKIEGKTDEEARKSYESAAKTKKGAVSFSSNPSQDENSEQNNADGDETAKEFNEAINKGEKLESFNVNLRGGAVGAGRLVCMGYGMATTISVVYKTKRAAQFMQFLMIVFPAVQSFMAGDGTPSEANVLLDIISPSKYPSKIMDPNTNKMVDNPWIGLNFTDAEEYKAAAYGFKGSVHPLSAKYYMAGGTVGALQDVLDWMNDNIGRDKIRTTCKILNNPVTGVVGFFAAPVLNIATEVLISILPLDQIAASIVNMGIDAITDVDLVNEAKGVPAGKITFAGLGALFSKQSAAMGLVPQAFPAVKKNMMANHELLEREVAMKKEEAAGTPFDITNRYSFLGSLANQVATLAPTSLAGSLTAPSMKLLSAFPTSLGMITSNANASYSMPVADYSELRFSQCKDEAYLELGVSPDLLCTLRFAPFEHVDSNEALKYMQDNNQIDSSGNPVPDSYFEKFKKYCSDREDPWGSTSVAAEDQEDDIEWYTGKKCIENTQENQMSSEFTGYKVIQETIDRETSSSQEGAVPVSGDARALAIQAANNPNLIWREVTKNQLIKFGNGEKVYDACGAEMSVSKYLLGALITNSSKYRVVINNIGFREDRPFCEAGTYQHPKGTAVDLNDIQIIGGAGTGGGISLPGSDLPIVNQYATDFLAALPLNRGGVGQSDHGVNPTFPPGSVALNGSHLFPDSGDHLHIDARNRLNLMDRE